MLKSDMLQYIMIQLSQHTRDLNNLRKIESLATADADKCLDWSQDGVICLVKLSSRQCGGNTSHQVSWKVLKKCHSEWLVQHN
jgi:hypothetical protein